MSGNRVNEFESNALAMSLDTYRYGFMCTSLGTSNFSINNSNQIIQSFATFNSSRRRYASFLELIGGKD